jgi:O-antigen ligase
MLVTCAAAAHLLFGKTPRVVGATGTPINARDAATLQPQREWTGDRQWTALVTPTLLIALMLTLTRNAWLGISAGIIVLLSLTNRKLLALLPLAFGLFLFVAPQTVSSRFYSIFDPSNPTNRDRVAMLHYGTRMVRDHPLTGVGPDMVKEVYAQYRDAEAVQRINFHLHNVPMQIAAERGLPALIIWIGFIVVVVRDLLRRFRTSCYPSMAAAGLAAVAAMLVAGMFEYNFGDSEFLMLFLVLITLPYAADRDPVEVETR